MTLTCKCRKNKNARSCFIHYAAFKKCFRFAANSEQPSGRARSEVCCPAEIRTGSKAAMGFSRTLVGGGWSILRRPQNIVPRRPLLPRQVISFQKHKSVVIE